MSFRAYVTFSTIVLLCCLSLQPAEAATAEENTALVRKLAQKQFANIPLVQVSAKREAIKFVNADLLPIHSLSKTFHYFAFRFKTPKQKGEFIWALNHSRNRDIYSWDIFRKSGDSIGFGAYTPLKVDQSSVTVGSRRDDVFVLPLTAIEADSEYVVVIGRNKDTKQLYSFSLSFVDSVGSPESSIEKYKTLFPMLSLFLK